MYILVIVILTAPVIITLAFFLLIKQNKDLHNETFSKKKKQDSSTPYLIEKEKLSTNFSEKTNPELLDFSGGNWGI